MKKLLVLCCLLALIVNKSNSQEINKITATYSIKGSDTLRLDKYTDLTIKTPKPCVLFVFGGGFVNGERDATEYLPYFERLSKEGYTVVSIDYRLGLKKLMTSGGALNTVKNPNDLVPLINNVINMAVEDLFDATSFIISKSNEWNIDTSMIIVSGSSAGAITALQAEYDICNQNILASKLPSNFNYAGVISFAGAILSLEGDLKWTRSFAPTMLFHADADKNVPYNKLEVGNCGLYGSKYISSILSAKKSPYYFYNVENCGHEYATQPMKDNLDEITTFLTKYVKEKQLLIINSQVKPLDKPEVTNKDFQVIDYLIGNGFINL